MPEPITLPFLEKGREPVGLSKNPVTELLFSCLTIKNIQTIKDNLDHEQQVFWNKYGTIELESKRTLLHLGVAQGNKAILKKTGLSNLTPPDTVHSMGRGSLAAGGSLYYADLLAETLDNAGISLPKKSKVLDFGSSSGRVLRTLKAAFPDYVCYGCDPNKEAIAWAKKNLSNIATFSVNTFLPPLDYKSNTFDLIFAISIWSHFNSKPAINWLHEMRRIIKTGGVFCMSIHSFRSVMHYYQKQLREASFLEKIHHDMLTEGFSFYNSFEGADGDWGVNDADWGEAYIAQDWLLNELAPDWSLIYYGRGLCEGNQDMVVLQAR